MVNGYYSGVRGSVMYLTLPTGKIERGRIGHYLVRDGPKYLDQVNGIETDNVNLFEGKVSNDILI